MFFGGHCKPIKYMHTSHVRKFVSGQKQSIFSIEMQICQLASLNSRT